MVLLVVLGIDIATMWKLPTFTRVLIAITCVPVGGWCFTQMDDRGTALTALLALTVLFGLAGLLLAPFKPTRALSLRALAAAAMLWTGYVSVGAVAALMMHTD